jgi:hypothetical protein
MIESVNNWLKSHEKLRSHHYSRKIARDILEIVSSILELLELDKHLYLPSSESLSKGIHGCVENLAINYLNRKIGASIAQTIL